MTGTVDQAAANAAPNIIAIYAAMMSTPGEQVACSALVLEDPGWTRNLITNELTETLMLPGQVILLLLKVLGHRHEERRLQDYVLSITDMYGKKHLIQAVGVNKITEVERAPKIRDLVRMFPGAGKEQARVFNRPYGTVHLLLGMASRSQYSRDGRKAGNLKLNRTVFYPGWVLTGKILAQEKFSSQIIANVNSAALTLQAAAIMGQVSSEQAKKESTGVQHKVSRSARRRRKKKRKEQQAYLHGADGVSAKSIVLHGWNKRDRRTTTSSAARRRPYNSFPR